MSDLRELYQELILDHGKHPRNFGAPEHADREAKGHNPLCGDRLTVYLVLDGDRIVDARFDGAGCAISTASASLMTETLKGRTLAEAEQIFAQFHDLVTGGRSHLDDPELEKLEVFAGVSEFPVRVKCATLAWHTLKAATAASSDAVSTE
ncbi:MAG: SUF system NifU family Fe-S cluster assembly protein [Planctomycetota bacterium]